jgi:hypothetical protein
VAEQLPAGGLELTLAEIDALWTDPWRPEQVAERLADVSVPWYIAAGWALDLFRGEQTREHGDLEIAVPARGFALIRDRLADLECDAVDSGLIWRSASADTLAATFQTWLREPGTGRYLLDVFREPHDGETWICRRDETIRLPYAEIIRHTPDGLPYLRPELVLLFKAKHARPKDEQDFAGTLPLLDDAQRSTLTALLARVHPGHPWLARLAPGSSAPTKARPRPRG